MNDVSNKQIRFWLHMLNDEVIEGTKRTTASTEEERNWVTGEAVNQGATGPTEHAIL